jgi:hydrogenase nickel incorporation protein HypB
VTPDGTTHIHIHIHLPDAAKPAVVAAPAPAVASKSTRTVSVEAKVLAENDRQADLNRDSFKEWGVVAINLISSPGSGKTRLLEKTLDALNGRISCAVITGDQQTDNDAQRLLGRGAEVVQIETRSACHLNAAQVAAHLEPVLAKGAELLFIENVGNLVCPAAFDLGETVRVALLSVTEGEDKPLKYPVLFHGAPVTVVTKIDLLPHLQCDMPKLRGAVQAVRHDARIIELSADTGAGMAEWLDYLMALCHP